MTCCEGKKYNTKTGDKDERLFYGSLGREEKDLIILFLLCKVAAHGHKERNDK